MTITRLIAATTATLLAMTTVVGLAAPAEAAFDNKPLRTWEPDGPVHAIAHSGNTVFIGGAFTTVTNPATDEIVDRGGLAAFDATSGELRRGWSPSADGDVLALTVSADASRIVVGGKFLHVNETPRRRLAALDPTSGALIAPWRGRAAGAVRDLLAIGKRVYVGGSFSQLNGVRDRGLGAVRASNGNRVDRFRASVDDTVHGLARRGRRVLLSGRFTSVNGSPRASLAAVRRTDGALRRWAPARLCTECDTYRDVATDGTRAYVGSAGPGGRVAAFDVASDARRWVTRSDGDVQAVDVGADGLVYIGGHFNRHVGGKERHQLAAVRPVTGAVDPDFAPRLFRPYPGVEAVVTTATRLYAGGHFSGVGRRGKTPYFAIFPTS